MRIKGFGASRHTAQHTPIGTLMKIRNGGFHFIFKPLMRILSVFISIGQRPQKGWGGRNIKDTILHNF